MKMMEMKKQTPPTASRSVAMAGPNWSSPSSTTTSTSSASALGVHRSSRPISKMKPKIRIIHIFAPEIIKTDAANFRELVQRLTGKPTDQDKPRKAEERSRADHHHHHHHQVKAEEEEQCKYEFWNNDTNYNTPSGSGGGGFLGGFPDLDGYFNTHDFGEFPLLYHPLLDAHHTMHVYEHDPRLIA